MGLYSRLLLRNSVSFYSRNRCSRLLLGGDLKLGLGRLFRAFGLGLEWMSLLLGVRGLELLVLGLIRLLGFRILGGLRENLQKITCIKIVILNGWGCGRKMVGVFEEEILIVR